MAAALPSLPHHFEPPSTPQKSSATRTRLLRLHSCALSVSDNACVAHSAVWLQTAYFPLPTSTDDVSGMSSTNTAGKGPNEPGSGALNKPNQHTTGTAGGRSPSASTPASSGDRARYGDEPPSSMPDASEVKTKAKRAVRKVQDKAKEVGENVSEGARHAAGRAKVGYESMKEDATHAVNTGVNSAKQAGRSVKRQSQSHADRLDSTVYTQSQPSSSFAAPEAHVYAGQSGFDSRSVGEKAGEASASVKAGLSSAVDSVKAAAGSVLDSIKSATSTAGEKLGQLKEAAAERKDNTAERLQRFGSRMEEKFEKMGENMMRSGEEIERRNREPDQPLPEPLPLDDVDHLPNPKDKNDVLPGTGLKDQKKNEPIVDRKGGGQFPG